MSDDNHDKVLGSLERNNKDVIVGYVNDYHGRTYGHLRIFVPTVDGEGLIRTIRGVAFTKSQVDALRKGIKDLWSRAGSNVMTLHLPIKMGKEAIRIGMNEYKGGLYVYVRVYYQDGSEQWKPTQQGITIPTSLLEKFEGLFELVAQELMSS